MLPLRRLIPIFTRALPGPVGHTLAARFPLLATYSNASAAAAVDLAVDR